MLAIPVSIVDKNNQVGKVDHVLTQLDNIDLVDMADIEPEI